MAPTIAADEAISATGSASRRLARFRFRRPGPGSKRAGEGHQQTGASHEIDIERKKSAHDRHEQHAAADAAEHRQDAEDEGHDEQSQRPDPPGCGRLGTADAIGAAACASPAQALS